MVHPTVLNFYSDIYCALAASQYSAASRRAITGLEFIIFGSGGCGYNDALMLSAMVSGRLASLPPGPFRTAAQNFYLLDFPPTINDRRQQLFDAVEFDPLDADADHPVITPADVLMAFGIFGVHPRQLPQAPYPFPGACPRETWQASRWNRPGLFTAAAGVVPNVAFESSAAPCAPQEPCLSDWDAPGSSSWNYPGYVPAPNSGLGPQEPASLGLDAPGTSSGTHTQPPLASAFTWAPDERVGCGWEPLWTPAWQDQDSQPESSLESTEPTGTILNQWLLQQPLPDQFDPIVMDSDGYVEFPDDSDADDVSSVYEQL